MTPLAQRVARELIAPEKKRWDGRNGWTSDHPGVLDFFPDVHCFECTQVADFAEDLANTACKQSAWSASDIFSFLPAPVTWIEYDVDVRGGFLLFKVPSESELCKSFPRFDFGEEAILCIRIFSHPELGWVESPLRCVWPADAGNNLPSPCFLLNNKNPDIETTNRMIEEGQWVRFFANAFLVLINSPNVVSDNVHSPHKGLAKKIGKSMNRKNPIHSWHEIKLHVLGEKSTFSENSVEGRRRALHFCRSHLRVRLGKLEHVSAHWRGDPTLGIRNSRYSVSV